MWYGKNMATLSTALYYLQLKSPAPRNTQQLVDDFVQAKSKTKTPLGVWTVRWGESNTAHRGSQLLACWQPPNGHGNDVPTLSWLSALCPRSTYQLMDVLNHAEFTALLRALIGAMRWMQGNLLCFTSIWNSLLLCNLALLFIFLSFLEVDALPGSIKRTR